MTISLEDLRLFISLGACAIALCIGLGIIAIVANPEREP